MPAEEVIKRFISELKGKYPNLSEAIIEKDFYLTLIFNEICKKSEHSPFNLLVLKGGTLLARVHLSYHRLSEDLDFTYLENDKLKRLSAKQRNKAISNFTSVLVEEIMDIGRVLNLDFSINKVDQRYCRVMDRKSVYLLKLYYRSVYGSENVLKFEVNFNDELAYSPISENITHLWSPDLIQEVEFLLNVKINLEKKLLCYDLREVALEKIRAILTRPVVKERDLLDLFLISQKVDLNELKKEAIIKKINCSRSFVKGMDQAIERNVLSLAGGEYKLLEEKSKLMLMDLSQEDYSKFEKKIIPVIIEIGKMVEYDKK